MNHSPMQNDQLEDRLFEFEQCWSENGTAAIDDFLPSTKASSYLEILTELVRSDMEFRWEKNDGRDATEYFQRFPILQANNDSKKAIVFEEYRLRNSHGDTISREDLCERHNLDSSGWPEFNADSSSFDSGNRRSSAPPDKKKIGFPEVGETFLNFELVGQLGDGAFGRVFLAQQGDLDGRLVVLKFTSVVTDEHRLLARLQHTNIVPIHSVHRVNDLQAICMPLLGVATLADVLQQCGKPNDPQRSSIQSQTLVRTVNQKRELTVAATISDANNARVFRSRQRLIENAQPSQNRVSLQHFAAEFIRQIADGLGFAHQRGIIHGDLKPANVLIDDDGNAVILDFHLGSSQHENIGQLVGGTIPYMAPEHLLSVETQTEIGPTADVYACGVMLYEILTGRIPYKSASQDLFSLEEFADVKKSPFQMSRQERSLIGEDLAAIIDTCLHPNPEQRYRNGSELANELDRHLQFKPLRRASNGSLKNRIQKWAKRNPRLSSASSILSVCSLFIAITLTAFFLVNSKLNRINAVTESQTHIEEAEAILPIYATNAQLDSSYFQSALDQSTQIANRNSWHNRDSLVNRTHFKRLDQPQATDELESAAQLHFWIAEACQQFAKSDEVVTYLNLALQHNQNAVSFWPADRSKQSLIRQKQNILTALGKDIDSTPALLNPTELNNRLDKKFSAYLDLGDPSRAEKQLIQLAEEDASDFMVWLMLGHVCAAQGKLSKAQAYYTICHSIDAKSSLPVLCRGIAKMQDKRVDLAIEDFKLADQLSPDDVTITLNYALALIRMRDFENARKRLDQAINLGAHQTRAWYLRSGVKKRLGDSKGAQEDMDRFLELQPTDEKSCITRGNMKIRNSPHEAIADFKAALRLDPNSQAAHNNLAHVYSEVLNDIQSAIVHMDKAIEIDPNNAQSLAARGVLWARRGERDKALSDAEKALKIDNSASTKYVVAGLFAQTSKVQPSDSEKAVALFAQAAFQDPGMVLRMISDDPDIGPIKTDETFTKVFTSIQNLQRPWSQKPK